MSYTAIFKDAGGNKVAEVSDLELVAEDEFGLYDFPQWLERLSYKHA